MFVTICLIIVSVLILNPFDFWMPNMMVIGMLIIVLVLFGFFASFILREASHDERDDVHKGLAGRYAFLGGALVLILGIVVQGYDHMVDPWLVLALTTMVVVKVLSRIWSDRNL